MPRAGQIELYRYSVFLTPGQSPQICTPCAITPPTLLASDRRQSYVLPV